MKLRRMAAWTLAIALLFLPSLQGCAGGNGGGENQTKSTAVSGGKPEPVNLIYYTIGNPDPDLKKVNDALNELLIKKINVTVQYNKIAWGDYETKISALVNSGSDFDMVFVNPGMYAENAKKGAFLDLTELLKKEGKAMYDAIDPLFWDGARINGKIYSVPTNKEIAVPEWWMYPKELVDKYQIDTGKYRTLESLEPLLAMIKKNEPEYQPMQLDKDAGNFFALQDYEYVISKEIPLMVKSGDRNLQVVNIFSTSFAVQTLRTLRKYYKLGYINEDAAIKDNQSLIKREKVFWKEAGGGPYSDVSWSTDRGYPIVAQQVSASMVTTESTRGGLMAVNARTKHPEACVAFLNLLNTDPEVRNLLNYGIEGTHYQLTPDDQVLKTSDAYSGIGYTQGNWFILKTTVGDPKDKWEKYKAFNKAAKKSEMLGFTADTSKISSQIFAVTQVWTKYYPCLMTGSVDPEVQLPKFLAELKEAGIDEIQKELQKQLDRWKSGMKE